MKSPKIWSLKSRLTWSFMAVVLCITLIISLLYYTTQRRLYEDNLRETDRNDAAYLMGNLEKQLRLCEKLSDWLYVNRQLETALVRDYADDMDQYSRDIPAVQRLINDQLASSSVGDYVVFLVVQGNNGVSFKANPDSYWVEGLEEQDWHLQGLDAGGRVEWTGIHENPAVHRSNDYVVPVVRPVIFSDTRAVIGWQALAFSPALVGDLFQDYHMDGDRSIIVLDRQGRAVFHNNRDRVGQAVDYDFLEELATAGQGSAMVTVEGRRMLATYRASPSGMSLLLLHSLTALERQTRLLLTVLAGIFAATAVMFLLLTYYLSNRLTKPLGGILRRLEAVSAGSFAPDPAIEGGDEMGQIGRGVNHMAGSIRSLMDELLQQERESRELEYRVLLNQINPHFVYNVLNSIKVMADLQKIPGISDMASSLGTLLREISKGKAEQIPIRRELELLESYLHLQKIRKCGLLTVHYHIPDEEALDRLIPRFTLQPLAENAIYHGLDQVTRMGVIDLSILLEGEDVVISLRDNGAGIPPERVPTLLSEEYTRGDELTHVGLANVDKRVKLFYGGGGLSIESRQGEYTLVTLRLPGGGP